MDIMVRRSLLMMLGGESEVWKKKTITAPSNMTTTSEVKSWLSTADLIPSCEIGILFIDVVKKPYDDNSFMFAPIIEGRIVTWGTSNTNGWYSRIRGNAYGNQYYQQRGFQNEETCNVYQGDTFTIFYQ